MAAFLFIGNLNQNHQAENHELIHNALSESLNVCLLVSFIELAQLVFTRSK